MGLFSDYTKRTRKIDGKRVSIFIQAKDLEDWIKFLREQLEDESDSSDEKMRLDAQYLLQFYKNYSDKKIRNMVVNLVFETFFKVIEDNTKILPPHGSLLIYTKIELSIPGAAEAAHSPLISKENVAFFQIDYLSLLHRLYRLYFDNEQKIIDFLKKTDFDASLPLYDLLSHELFHYIDLRVGKQLIMAGERLKNIYKKTITGLVPRDEPIGLSTVLRVEGLAMFFERRKKKFIEYKQNIVKEAKRVLQNYFNAIKIPSDDFIDKYICGMYMHYFIALSYLYKKNTEAFNGMRIYFEKDDFLFFAEGIGNILNSKKAKSQDTLLLQNLPENLIVDYCNTMLRFSHLSFIKEYEEACKMLNIPNEHIILIFEDYLKLKRIFYDKWQEEVKKSGFSTRGLKLED